MVKEEVNYDDAFIFKRLHGKLNILLYNTCISVHYCDFAFILYFCKEKKRRKKCQKNSNNKGIKLFFKVGWKILLH